MILINIEINFLQLGNGQYELYFQTITNMKYAEHYPRMTRNLLREREKSLHALINELLTKNMALILLTNFEISHYWSVNYLFRHEKQNHWLNVQADNIIVSK